MAEDWDFYLCMVNDAPSSVMVDLGLRESAPQPECPWLLWVWVLMLNPREDGLSSSDEAPRLWEIGDRLEALVAERLGTVTAGRITGMGRREFYFYGSRTEGFDEAIREAMAGFAGYRYNHRVHEDPDWSQYLKVLYPGTRDMQRIWDRRVVEGLKEQGDVLHLPRDVDHHLYFPSAQSRQSFVARAKGQGYSVRDTTTEDASHPSANRFGLHLSRSHAVDPETIDGLVTELIEWAEAVGGDYDGWGTTVVREVPRGSVWNRLPWRR